MPMSDADRIVWAAMFARTNMGQSMPDADMIRRYRTAAKHGTSLEAMVNMVCGDFTENDYHYTMFLAEARGWFNTFKKKPDDYIFVTWPHKRAVWEASEDVV